MNRLNMYEKVSGQLINKNKSGFLLLANFPLDYIHDVENVTGFSQLKFPFQYLGCPIYRRKKKIVYFNNMVAKVSHKLQGWLGNFLS